MCELFCVIGMCIFTGATKDHQTLRELGISNGAKVMAIGCSLNDVISVTPTKEDLQAATHSSPESRESFSQQKVSQRIYLLAII